MSPAQIVCPAFAHAILKLPIINTYHDTTNGMTNNFRSNFKGSRLLKYNTKYCKTYMQWITWHVYGTTGNKGYHGCLTLTYF